MISIEANPLGVVAKREISLRTLEGKNSSLMSMIIDLLIYLHIL